MYKTYSTWCLPPEALKLNSNEIHVWRASLDTDACGIQSLYETLSADEQQRAALFYFPKDRERFTVARGLLREILSRYLQQNPSDISFYYNQHGKPALHTDGEDSLHFNVSHSHRLVLYAITRDCPIGVDLEYIRTDFPYQEIAEKFFSPKENAMLRSLPAQLQPKAFFTCWSRKEAYLKAIGKGLSIPLNLFEVSLLPEEPAGLLSIQGDIEAATHWSLQDLYPSPDYVAALAIQRHNWQLKYWQWTLL